jgi:hypothetical protein
LPSSLIIKSAGDMTRVILDGIKGYKNPGACKIKRRPIPFFILQQGSD